MPNCETFLSKSSVLTEGVKYYESIFSYFCVTRNQVLSKCMLFFVQVEIILLDINKKIQCHQRLLPTDKNRIEFHLKRSYGGESYVFEGNRFPAAIFITTRTIHQELLLTRTQFEKHQLDFHMSRFLSGKPAPTDKKCLLKTVTN